MYKVSVFVKIAVWGQQILSLGFYLERILQNMQPKMPGAEEWITTDNTDIIDESQDQLQNSLKLMNEDSTRTGLVI